MEEKKNAAHYRSLNTLEPKLEPLEMDNLQYRAVDDQREDEDAGQCGCSGCCGRYTQKYCRLKTLTRRVPITGWLPRYQLNWLNNDVIAGLTVGLTVIPQGLAYASVANLPLEYGLYSAFMGCFVYCVFGTSKDITLGPTAIMSLMVGQYCFGEHAQTRAAYAVVLALMVGLVQLAMGMLNLGFIVSFLSLPVVSGFTSAASIIIGFGQVKKVLGVTTPKHESHIGAFIWDVIDTCAAIPETRYQDLLLGLGCIAFLTALKKMKDYNWGEQDLEPTMAQRLSRGFIWLLCTARNAVIVLIAAIIAYALEVAQRDPFTLTGEVNAGLPSFKPPNFYITDGNVTIGPSKMLSQLGSGLAVVPLIGILESIVIAKAFARKNRYKIDPTQELLALGLANILGSFVSAYPVTGSFSRTAVNSQSGVKTPAGGILTGVLALLALSFLSAAFTYIPQATLAAIIICAVASMFEYEIVAKIWRTKKLDLVPLFVTFLACLGLGIEYGIMAGVGVSLIFLLYNMARPGLRVTDAGGSIAEHGEAPPPPDSTSDAANHNVAVDEKREGGVLVMRPEQSFYFPATQNIADAVIKQSRQNDIPNPVIFDCSHISGMDFTSVQALESITEDFKSISQPIVFINLSQELLDQLARARIKNFVHRSSTSEAMIAIHAMMEQATELDDMPSL